MKVIVELDKETVGELLKATGHLNFQSAARLAVQIFLRRKKSKK
jgi:hypothetical protein